MTDGGSLIVSYAFDLRDHYRPGLEFLADKCLVFSSLVLHLLKKKCTGQDDDRFDGVTLLELEFLTRLSDD
jgi:hypothetical protein